MSAAPGRLSVLRKALRFGLQWRLLLWWVLGLSLPALLALLPLWRLLAQALDPSVQAPQWAQHAELPMLVDLIGRLVADGPLFPASLLGALLLFVGTLPLLNAMQVAAVRAPRPLRLGELLGAGLHEYWPLLRLMLWSLLLFGLAGGLGAGAAFLLRKFRETAILESDVSLLKAGLAVPVVLVFAWVAASVDAARAALADAPARRSALRALWRGVRLTARYPLASLLRYFGCSLPVLLVLSALLWLRLQLPVLAWPGWLAAQALGLLITALPGALHAARLHAMLQLGRSAPRSPFTPR